MRITDILQRDPAEHPLVNQGQARIGDTANEEVLRELRGELATFVCEGQYADGMQRILSSYLANLSQTNQRAAWVSGFFGSGKSHFLKMLCHLWVDTKFPDGTTARSLVPSMPDELVSLLKELDTAGRRAGGLVAAAGSLPSGTTEQVRSTVLGVLLKGTGLPDQYPQAQFCLWLHEHGWLTKVKASVGTAGKTWIAELNNLYVSGVIARAVLACDPNFAPSEAEARKALRAQFPPRTTDITTGEFLSACKRALAMVGRDGRFPCTVLVLDEVQQYIGDSSDRSTLIMEVTEAIAKTLSSHAIVVASGQSALSSTSKLQKLMDRYTIRVQLSDTDVETVTRKVLLQKKPSAIQDVRKALETHGGEVSRQLQGTKIGETSHDRHVIVDDYPLLPVRRRFWEACFRQVDAAGTQSQLRSQLRIIHDAVADVSPQELGTVVPADVLFEALAPELVNTGVLLREINERIIGLAQDGSAEGRLARRVCGLVFLISRLPRQPGADIGVRASKEHIADLLVSDLRADNGRLRSDVESVLERLSTDGALMKVGDEYRLQTKEGAEWDREFRLRQSRLVHDDADYQIRRDQFIYAEVDRVVRGVKIAQGAAKVARPFVVFRDQTPPLPLADGIPVWVCDGWSTTEKEVADAARGAGTDSATLFAWIHRQSADELKKAIVDAEAAEQTMGAKGAPTTKEGEEARQSMESRRNLAVRQRDELVSQVVANAKVFQGGGSELLQVALADRLRDGATAALVRLFPRFKEADAPSSSWEQAIKRAREGADQPFQPVGYDGPIEKHTVCQQVLLTVGPGKAGNDLRKLLEASPFGWPRDAIAAALIALHRSQHISATLNGAPVPLGQLDQNKISKTEFRAEHVTLTVPDRLAIRKLFQGLGVNCKAGEEQAKAPEFLEKLVRLATSTGGDAPLPSPPATAQIDDLRRRVGNDQLASIRDGVNELEKRIAEWKKTAELVDTRRRAWAIVEQLARQAAGLVSAAETLKQFEAVRAGRLLLEPTDPVSPLRTALSDALRRALLGAHEAHVNASQQALATLDQSPLWQRVKATERSSIIANVGLAMPSAVDVSSDETLLRSLEARPLSAREADVDAVSGRVKRALEEAARLLEPKVRSIALERATLGSPDEVERWLDRQRQMLLAAIQDGPVLVQ